MTYLKAAALIPLAATSFAMGMWVGPVSANPPSANPPSANSPSPAHLRQQLLTAHNHHRAQAGARPLRWSSTLAAQAQQWANYLAKTGRFQHAQPSQLHRSGENLLQVMNPGSFSLADYVNVWAAERKDFIPGRPFSDRSSKSGSWSDVGHYSQLVWQRTTQVGCGIATANNRDVLVCRYNPSGNIFGQRP